MILSGRFFEEKHRELFIRKCPRPAREPYTKCLYNIWKELIDDLQAIDQDLEKVIRGRKGNREVDPLLLNDILQDLEVKVRERLLETKKGIDFLEQEGINGLKMVVYCVLNCGKLVSGFYKKSNKISEMKLALLHEVIIYYYLKGDNNVSNSTIQQYEKMIEKRKKLKKEGKLKKRDPVDLSVFKEVEEYETNKDTKNTILNAWDDFSKRDDKPMLEKIEQRDELEDKVESLEENILDIESLLDFNFTQILEGDEELTDVLLDFCPKGERQDFTCEVDNEFYNLVSTRLIHSFLKNTELFKEIDLTAECLVEEKPDVTKLRRKVDLYIRRYGKHWDWTPELKN